MKNDPDIPDKYAAKLSELFSKYESASKEGASGKMEGIAGTVMSLISMNVDIDKSENTKLYLDAENALIQGDFDTAETLLRKRLDLEETLMNPALIYKAHSDLSEFYEYIGDRVQALEEEMKGLELARKSPLLQILGMSLIGVTTCYLRLDKPLEALEYANELLNISSIRKLPDILQARTSILRAKCYVQLSEIGKAEQDLETGWTIVSPMKDGKRMAGYQSILAMYWEVKAVIFQLENNYAGAIQAIEHALEHRTNVCQSPYLSGPYAIYSFIKTLEKLESLFLQINNEDSASQVKNSCMELKQFINYPI